MKIFSLRKSFTVLLLPKEITLYLLHYVNYLYPLIQNNHMSKNKHNKIGLT